MSLQDKVIKALESLQDEGNNLQSDVNEISSHSDLYVLIAKFNIWDEKASDILKQAFVQQQLYRMFSGVEYLGNVYTDPQSFQHLRSALIYKLAQKMNHLRTAISTAGSGRNIDFQPFNDNHTAIVKKNNMKKLFISHANADDAKIRPLIDLLEGIGVPSNSIFYSSHVAYGVPLGENIFDKLKIELSSDEIFALFILSENFYKSAVCLCEMGAVWIKSNKQVPILIPPFGFSDVKGVFPNSLGFKIDDKNQLNSLKDQLEQFFELSPINITRWEEKRAEYLKKMEELLK